STLLTTSYKNLIEIFSYLLVNKNKIVKKITVSENSKRIVFVGKNIKLRKKKFLFRILNEALFKKNWLRW
ncbi:MAG: hypothetical protein ACP5KX_08025, partial [Caldisericia bacterium]